MQRRAARALEAVGDVPAALSLYARARLQDDLLRLLAAHGFELLDQAHADTVQEAVDALSPDVRATNALVLGLRASAEARAGRFDRAESLLRRAMQRTSESPLRAQLALMLAAMLFQQGRDAFELLEPHASDETLAPKVRAQAVSLLAPAYASAGRISNANRALRDAQAFLLTLDAEDVRAKVLHRLAFAATLLGRPREELEALYTSAQSLAMQCGLYVTAAAAFGGLATVALFYEDDLAKYVWYAQQGLNASMKAGDRFSMQTALLHLIHAETLRGNAERLAALERQLAAVTTSDTGRLSYVVVSKAMTAAWDGRFEEAYRLLSSLPDRTFYDFDRLFKRAMHAICAVCCGRRESALETVASVVDELQRTDLPYLYAARTAEIARLFCAATEALAGRVTNANRLLQRGAVADGPAVHGTREVVLALTRSVKNPALRSEVDDALVQLRSPGYGGLARLLERAAAKFFDEHGVTHVLLTHAEIEVLRRLADGSSPKDIALESGRSVYTVQAHVQNIIKKLGCSGRNEALSVARKRGLLA